MSEKAIIRVARQIEASTKVPSGEASKKRDPAPAKRLGDESKAERQTAEQASSDDDDDDSPSEMSLIIARLMDGQQKMADEMAALRLLLTSIKQEPQQQQQQPPPQQQQDGSAVQPTFIPQQPKGAAPPTTPSLLPLLANMGAPRGVQPPPINTSLSSSSSSESSAPRLSGAHAGAQAPSRYEEMLLSALGENRNMLEIHNKEQAALALLHKPAVGNHPSLNYFPHTSTSTPKLELPSRLRHIKPSEGPTSTADLLTRFLVEESKGTLRQKKIKDWEEWMRGMQETLVDAASKGHSQLVGQVMSYVRYMTELKESYGWAAAQFYWYELQKEIEDGYHSLEHGSPVNVAVMLRLQEKYQRLAGRPAASSAAAAIPAKAPATTKKADNNRRSNSSGNSNKSRGSRTFECEIHGTNGTHSSTECRVLLNRRTGSASSSSSSSSSGGGESKAK